MLSVGSYCINLQCIVKNIGLWSVRHSHCHLPCGPAPALTPRNYLLPASDPVHIATGSDCMLEGRAITLWQPQRVCQHSILPVHHTAHLEIFSKREGGKQKTQQYIFFLSPIPVTFTHSWAPSWSLTNCPKEKSSQSHTRSARRHLICNITCGLSPPHTSPTPNAASVRHPQPHNVRASPRR